MDKETFIEKILPFRDKIYRFALYFTKDIHAADDITQDILEKMWMKRDVLGKYDNLESMIICSVRNLCLDKIKTNKLHYDKLADYKYRINIFSTTNENFDTLKIVETAIESLPEKQQTVIHLRDIEGYEIKDIAQIMNIKEDITRVILSRARKALKAELIKVMNYGI